MIGYRLVSTALEEASDAASYYEDASVGLGSEFLNELDKTIGQIRKFPKIGALLGRRVRRFPISRFPFDVIYYLSNNKIVIIAVAHQSRRPGYWRDRIAE
jgi:plasmid stabilization system protein ParE